jgi:hypothetical protein
MPVKWDSFRLPGGYKGITIFGFKIVIPFWWKKKTKMKKV